MEMIKRRNDTSHTYDEDMAKEVVMSVKDVYFDALVALYREIRCLLSNAEIDLFSQNK